MEGALLAAIAFTLGVSAFCSLLEAFVLSTTTVEVETLKQRHKRMGLMLEKFKTDIEETSSAILALNTIANTCGATFVGGFFVYGICSFYLEHLADRRAAKAAEDAAGESSTLCDNADATQSSGLRSRKNASERWLPRAAQNDHVWRAVSGCVACR